MNKSSRTFEEAKRVLRLNLSCMITKSSIKYIQSLQHKKERDLSGCFVAEGSKVVFELLQSQIFKCVELYALQVWFDMPTVQSMIPSDIPCQVVDEAILRKMSGLITPNQVLAVFRKKTNSNSIDVKGLILALDKIQDPGNMGTIIRSADWFGISGIVCSNDSADIYNPKVVQSTMASLGRVEIHYTDLSMWLSSMHNIPIFAAELQGEHPAVLQKPDHLILVLGNESKGVSDEIKSFCSRQVSIPKFGHAESLNVAMAASILMYARKNT